MAAAMDEAAWSDARPTRPNIVLILIDDLGWRDLTCYGSSFYETPNLDRLATQGMLFTDAYAACPVCSPTRASIMSGKYPARVGVTNYIPGNERGRVIGAPYTDHLPADEVSLAAALRAGGYATWHLGKWHLGGRPFYPENHGFDVNIGGCDWGHPRQGYFSPYGIETLADGPEGEYFTDRITDEAVRLVTAHNDDRPFFMNLWHYAVHTPIQAKPEDVTKYEAKARALGLAETEAVIEGEHFPTEHKQHLRVQRRVIQSHPAYAAMVENLDWNIGRLLQAFDEAGQADNTLVAFTSDNGGLATSEGSPTCNSPLAEGKGWMFEGGTREPLIVRWPGVVKAGSQCSVPVTSPDFYPTLLDAAQLAPMPEQHVDGVSLMPLLCGEGELDRNAIFWHYPHYGNQGGTPGSSVRMGDYKLIEFLEDGRLELYDLRADVSEEVNLAGAMPDLAAEMHRMLIRWRESVGARIPEPNPDFAVGASSTA